jgi:hypothetical protein
MKRAYELQVYVDDRREGDTLVRVSDGAEIAYDYGEPEGRTFSRDFRPVVDELNRLAFENSALREERDEKTKRLQAEVDQLKMQLSLKTEEARGQGVFWPRPIQY